MSRLTSEPQRFHIAMNIQESLRKPEKDLDGIIYSDGAPVSGAQAKDFFRHLLAERPALEWFTGSHCDNQDETGSCQGHAIEEGGAQPMTDDMSATGMDTSAMHREDIKAIFLANGFTEKDQGSGRMDLNPYVYDAAYALLAAFKDQQTVISIDEPNLDEILAGAQKRISAMVDLLSTATPGVQNPAPAVPHLGEPIRLTAVAKLVDDADGGLEASWLLEGGTAELLAGMTLLVAENAPGLCEEDGSAEVYMVKKDRN